MDDPEEEQPGTPAGSSASGDVRDIDDTRPDATDEGSDVTDDATPSERIRELATQAHAAREAFESPANPPDEARAKELLREGFGPTVWVYVEGRTGGRSVRFSETDLLLLRRTMNEWLELYAHCYGVELDARFTVREAAKLLVETRDIYDTAQLLTRVPER